MTKRTAEPIKDSTAIVGIIQCAIALEYCSGFNCSKAFAARSHHFTGYGTDVLGITLSCGGCPGRRISRLSAHLARKALKQMGATKDRIVFHFTGCVIGDNSHYPVCPFKTHMKKILVNKGFKVINGGYTLEKSPENLTAARIPDAAEPVVVL